MSATLDYLEQLIGEIRHRRRRVAELGGILEPDLAFFAMPGSMLVEFVEDIAAHLREQQEELERAALEATR
jgi:hypothetical protein